MKRLIPRLAVALATFTFGVAAAALYISLNTPPDIPPPHIPQPAVALHAEAPAPVSACFPGLSMGTRYMGKVIYFPGGVFSDNERRDEFRVRWYTEHLAAMGEPSLYFCCITPGESYQVLRAEESYRFLWLRSFHHPVAVRVWRSGDEHFLVVKQLDGAGGYAPGKLSVNRTRPLSKDEWDEFVRLLDGICYWQMPTEDSRLGNDGAQWILEGMKDGRYHVVDRWSPDGGDYRAACLHLLKLSGLGVNPKGVDVY
jgi:hypothetical protein